MTVAEREARTQAVANPAATAVVVDMSAAERSDLMELVRRRENEALADAKEYRATLMANFERKLATNYKPDDHPVWKQAHDAARQAGEEAMAKIATTFRELGIPETWAPSISVSWYGRGKNASNARRVQLRRTAGAEAERRLKSVEAAIKKASAEMQERILVTGFSSNAARELLALMPTPAQLMPELELEAIERITAPDHRSALGYGDD